MLEACVSGDLLHRLVSCRKRFAILEAKHKQIEIKGYLKLKKNTRKQFSRAGVLVFIIYISILIYFVFFSDHYGRTTGFQDFRYNLTLFAEIKRYINHRDYFTWENLLTNLVGNILVFAPMGILIPIMRKKKTGFFTVLASSFFLSLFIETVQLVFRVGVFDVDDLLMNTIGGGLGYVLFLLGKLHFCRKYMPSPKGKNRKKGKNKKK